VVDLPADIEMLTCIGKFVQSDEICCRLALLWDLVSPSKMPVA
jgi:hypothetical protein